jgi:hypothetical protein
MSSLLVSIRISGVEPEQLNNALEPHLSALLQHLNKLPDIEAECFISSKKPDIVVRRSAKLRKPRIVHDPVPLSAALNGRICQNLARYGFTTLNQVAWMSRREIGHIGGIGKNSLDAIEAALNKYNMHWLYYRMALNQRDWQHLPVGALELMHFLPESVFPRALDRKLELGQYMGFSDERLAGMLGDIFQNRVMSPSSDKIQQHRAFIERVRPLVD